MNIAKHIHIRPEFEAKLSTMVAAGNHLLIVSDFDHTLTHYFTPSHTRPTSKQGHEILLHGLCLLGFEEGKFSDRVLPLLAVSDSPPNLPDDEMLKLSEWWWNQVHKEMVEGGITKADVLRAIKAVDTTLREGVFEFISMVESNEDFVGLAVVSAGVSDVIEGLFAANGHNLTALQNVRIISNRMEFDDNTGACVRVHPAAPIHWMNKPHCLKEHRDVIHQLCGSHKQSKCAYKLINALGCSR
jgi:hypothetical protein